jgi:hypothetical protein
MDREGGVLRLRGGKVGGVKAKDLWDKVGAAPDTTRAAATGPKLPRLPPAIFEFPGWCTLTDCEGVAWMERCGILHFHSQKDCETGCARPPARRQSRRADTNSLQTMGDLNGMEEELRTELMSLRVAQQVGTRQQQALPLAQFAAPPPPPPPPPPLPRFEGKVQTQWRCPSAPRILLCFHPPWHVGERGFLLSTCRSF